MPSACWHGPLSQRDNGLAVSVNLFQFLLAGSPFVLFNSYYLPVIRYCQSVRGKQRALNKSFGNKRLQMKSQACVCDCHLFSLPWEKLMRLSSFAALWAWRIHSLQYVFYFPWISVILLLQLCKLHIIHRLQYKCKKFKSSFRQTFKSKFDWDHF